MKLQEFFDTQKHISFTDVDKLNLYQNILYKKTKRASFKRFSFIPAKYVIYSMIFMIMLFGVYGIYFFNNGSLQDYNRFSIIKDGANTAQAEYIAQIIEVEGNFFIEHDGILTKTNNISNGDTILVKEGAQLAFEINSGAQSKIIGPAKLIIQQTHDENYKLNLIYGDFIKMEGDKQKEQNIELAINDITLKQADETQPLKFECIKDGNNTIIKNNGANLVVTKKNGTEKTTTMTNNEVMAIQQNDIQLFTNFDNFSQAIAKKDVSQTFSLTTPEEMTISGIENSDSSSLLNLLNTTNVSKVNPEITKNISETLSDNKKILDPSQDEKISATLHTTFFMNDLKEIDIAFVAGNESPYMEAFDLLEKKIQTIYQIFDITYNKQGGDASQKLQGLKSAIINLQEKITTTYNIPPTYTDSLQTIIKELTNILAKGYGSATPQEKITTETAEKTQ